MATRWVTTAARGTTALLMLLSAGLVQAQEAPTFMPYTFAAAGGVSNGGTTLHVGGGFDTIVWKGLGASIEGGYLGPFPDGFDHGIGVISTNAVYHFGAPQRRRFTPFVTGGYSLAFRSSVGHALNLGAGANYWLSEGVALRLELRDHVPLHGGIRDEHFWGARIGFTWAR
jgi:hypothetical protein